MRGKTCVITGATDGIGLEAAGRLGALGARLVLIGRNRTKGDTALATLRTRVPGVVVEMHYADLSRQNEIRRLAPELLATASRIDVLINNAGGFFEKREITADGIERTFALNHLGYFLLTDLLRERIIASAPARIVNVASGAHRRTTLDFADLQTAHVYNGWKAYQRSKLCNILFTRELARRLAGTGVTANSLHPGLVATSFADNNRGWMRFAFGIAKRVIGLSIEAGAETPVYLASSPAVEGITGLYFGKCKADSPSAAAQDYQVASRLWRESAALTGLQS